MVAADLIQAEQVAFDQAAAPLRLPNAGERASEAASGVRELSPGLRAAIEDRAAYDGSAAGHLDPPQAGPEAFPQGSLAPQARAGSDPEPRKQGLA